MNNILITKNRGIIGVNLNESLQTTTIYFSKRSMLRKEEIPTQHPV